MPPFDNTHDKVLIPFKSGVGGTAIEEFENYLNEDGNRIVEERNREIQQLNNYDEVNILDPENMDNVEIAAYQWYQDNPGWWQN